MGITPTPDSSMNASGSFAPTVPTPAPSPAAVPAPTAAPTSPDFQAQATQANQNATTALQNAAKIANAPTAAPPDPHGRLLAMVSGLALGFDAFGKSLATRGREGGVQEVQQVQAARAQQQREAVAAQQALRNSQIQQQLTIADTNTNLVKNIHNLATLLPDIEMSHLQVERGQQELNVTAADEAQKYGMPVEDYLKALSDPTPNAQQSANAGVSTNAPSMIIRQRADQTLRAAQTVLPTTDPYTQRLKATMASTSATNGDLIRATTAVASQQSMQSEAAKEKSEIGAAQIAGIPKTQEEAHAFLASAENSKDPERIRQAKNISDAVDSSVEKERSFQSNLQAANQAAMKDLTFAQKGVEDIDKIWNDPQHGYGQTQAMISAAKGLAAQAKNGNELAANLEPLMTALGVSSYAGVHRINDTEIKQAGPEAGSLYRQLNALLDKAGSGTVPPPTLVEMNSIMDGLLRAKYQTALSSTKQYQANQSKNIPANKILVPTFNDPLKLVPLTEATGASASGGGFWSQFPDARPH